MGDPEMTLSIIVPVYNVAEYLCKCLDSLLNQDVALEDYEIIIVNDGSTDNSVGIAQRYADRYSNIVLINQENQGLSGARNSGIRVAKGKYIQFVDSDDYLEPNVLGGLVRKMEKDALDILRFNYQNVNERYEVFSPNKNPKQYVDYRDSITDGLTFLNQRLGPACYVWQFIFRTDLVRSLPLFKPGIYFEDTEWTPRMIVAANRVTSVDTVVYNYLVRQGSITNAVTEEKKRKLISDSIGIIDDMKEQMIGKSDYQWYEGMISIIVISVLGRIFDYSLREIRKYIHELKLLGVFPISAYHLGKGALRKRSLINISPWLFCLSQKLKKRFVKM